ncbi:MAG: hypothetical protein ACYTHM_10515 [Planctomycetota bacterium]|jgi:hypothetical protein
MKFTLRGIRFPLRFVLPALAPVLIGLAGQAHGGEKNPKPGRKEKGSVEPFRLAKPRGMTYHLYTPPGLEKGRKYPLLVALHGNGQPATGYMKWVMACSSDAYPVFVVTPQYQAIPGTTNSPVFKGYEEGVLKIIQYLTWKKPIDPGRVYYQGFSMGAGYCSKWFIDLAKKEPDRFPFRAMIYNSGSWGLLQDVRPPPIPHLIFVGAKEDTRVYKAVFNQYFRWKREVRYFEIEGMGHKINRECRRIIREFLASDARRESPFSKMRLDKKASKLAAEFEAGKWGEVWKTLLERIDGSDVSAGDRASARRMKEAIEVFFRKETARLKTSAASLLKLSEYLRLEKITKAFPQTELAHEAVLAMDTALESKALFREVEAYIKFHKAWDLEIQSSDEGLEAFQALAKDFPETEYGKRAKERLHTLE